MAAVSYPMSPARQPFAVLGEARLRTANSIKNQQNGATAKSLKRRLDMSDTADAENIDPLLMGSPSKRNKGGIQVHQDTTITTNNTSKGAKQQLGIHPSCASNSRSDASLCSSQSTSWPFSKVKGKEREGLWAAVALASTALTLPPRTSVAWARVPFSIADALNGTFTVSRPVVESASSTTAKTRRPKAWDFEIHADTEQDEMANLMEHSTCVLDISDDEEKQARENRGKENIPPPASGNNEPSTTQRTSATAPRNVEMGDEPRSPLGELDVKAFVPEGEDINGIVIIPEDEDDTSAEQNPTVGPTEKCLDTTTKQESKPVVQSESLSKTKISAPLDCTAPKSQVKEPAKKDTSATEIKIWESSSEPEEAFATAESEQPVEPTDPLSS
ncbi:hypothetical protein MGYG_03923 [Nannizzia gypsea CBS 118893]|uniref:Uncharacterized protein n=1 Tax=Arthroderma gypseum (strain ATCC MYA-4604 / CBS 118893) TaxID=535722 RepID=E4UUF3_ARTGP|nr:hypothetical protein MGYG_03923 [Nannizzia gypsea CBS 118893]EFR00920.1 hypothetical protein MGYG_03923 [Nannizzia gypsea CBS 118893]